MAMEPRDEFDFEIDLPPEYCRYRDDGCELAPSCLECPFEKCVYEERGGAYHWVKTQRDSDIVKLYKEGKRVKELAEIFGVSRRTVHRALKEAGVKIERRGKSNEK